VLWTTLLAMDSHCGCSPPSSMGGNVPHASFCEAPMRDDVWDMKERSTDVQPEHLSFAGFI